MCCRGGNFRNNGAGTARVARVYASSNKGASRREAVSAQQCTQSQFDASALRQLLPQRLLALTKAHYATAALKKAAKRTVQRVVVQHGRGTPVCVAQEVVQRALNAAAEERRGL